VKRAVSIVQRLREIQSRDGYLSDSALRELSRTDGIPLARLQEVLSYFRPHFLSEPPPRCAVRVCRDMACNLAGAAKLTGLLKQIPAASDPRLLTVEGTSCLGRCDRAPAVTVNHRIYAGRSADGLRQVLDAFLNSPRAPEPDADGGYACHTNPWQIDWYADNPGSQPYRAVARFRANPDPGRVLAELEASGLRGMGGAGAPAVKKWKDVRGEPVTPKYVVCNGDESEPGTFKDREILLRKAHLVVEGVLLGALTVGASRGYFYIRHEYEEQARAVERAIADARRVVPEVTLEVFRSPGGYICGEQSALLEAMDDRRAEPRNRPPQLETNGYRDQPTLLNNVETFAWLPAILLRGGVWYRDQGVNGCKGLRLFSVCGDVKRPGVYEVAVGSPLGELLELHAGGTTDGRPAKAVATSGPSGGFLPLRLPLAAFPPETRRRAPPRLLSEDGQALDLLKFDLDLSLFRDKLELALGAGIVVYGQGRDMAAEALNCTEFFRNESCGKCVPCRLGSEKLVGIGTALLRGDLHAEQLEAEAESVRLLGQVMRETSICGLGAVAPAPLSTLLRFFPEDVERHVARRPAQVKPLPIV
jgi:NADH:ubiquinone oxidoreductase subunit F (NADH-binding)/NADH:ubiquinone oxidoreductase subunit E